MLLLVFIVCFGGAVFPPIAADLYVLVVSAASTPARLPLLIIVATIAQVMGKMLVYGAGRGWHGVHLPAALARFRSSALRGQQASGLIVLVSALAGFPPFFPVSFAAGVVRVTLVRFTIAALAGRAVRLTVIAVLPHVWRIVG